MGLSRQKLREIVFQILYSHAFEKSDADSITSFMMRANAIPRSAAYLAMETAEKIWTCHSRLDEVIAARSNEFPLETVGRVEQAILRLAIYELMHTDLPPKVPLSEAVRIAKKYATKEGSAFVNALLDRINKELCSKQLPPKGGSFMVSS
jgi:transcription antitermination protein NusB